MEWRFNRVFAAEIVIIAVSIGALALWHDDIGHLPLAYAAGYAVGLLQLIIGAGLIWPKGGRVTAVCRVGCCATSPSSSVPINR